MLFVRPDSHPGTQCEPGSRVSDLLQCGSGQAPPGTGRVRGWGRQEALGKGGNSLCFTDMNIQNLNSSVPACLFPKLNNGWWALSWGVAVPNLSLGCQAAQCQVPWLPVSSRCLLPHFWDTWDSCVQNPSQELIILLPPPLSPLVIISSPIKYIFRLSFVFLY